MIGENTSFVWASGGYINIVSHGVQLFIIYIQEIKKGILDRRSASLNK
jgi:LDH2 family malate/lactate/ureidoglycolate dehydrogenase